MVAESVAGHEGTEHGVDAQSWQCPSFYVDQQEQIIQTGRDLKASSELGKSQKAQNEEKESN